MTPHEQALAEVAGVVHTMGRRLDSADRADGQIEWEIRPRAGWEEFCAARARLAARLDRHATFHRVEHGAERPTVESPIQRRHP